MVGSVTYTVQYLYPSNANGRIAPGGALTFRLTTSGQTVAQVMSSQCSFNGQTVILYGLMGKYYFRNRNSLRRALA